MLPSCRALDPIPSLVVRRALTSYNEYWSHAWVLAGNRYAHRTAVFTGESQQLEGRLRRELLFCLLGGHGISYELNQSAADRLWNLGVLAGGAVSTAELHEQLARPQFEPVCRDGGLRRYRFPVRKSELLSRASAWMSERRPLARLLLEYPEERARRRALLDCPGIGPKSASWLLRNVGLARRLAILDIHVLRTMRACGRVGALRLPHEYEQVEKAFLDWCDELNADPAGFDLLVWDWSRRRAA